MSGPGTTGSTRTDEHGATDLPVPAATALSDPHRQIVDAATRAPSVHNSQPWRFTVDDGGLDLFADHGRQLPVLDPQGRQLHLSCGAALLHAQVAARALGFDTVPQLLPNPADPDHLARLTLTPGPDPSGSELALADAIGLRHTYRDAFTEQQLSDGLLERLRLAAEAQGARLRPLTDPGELLEMAVLLSRADAVQEADPAYREELAASIHTEPVDDGIPAAALPADAERGSSLRLRNFALGAAAGADDARPGGGEPPVAERPDVVVIVSADDAPLSWLQAGQALGAVLLQAAQEGVMAQPLAQVTDFPTFRLRLGKALGLLGTPQLALRLGYATDTGAGIGTPRRSVADVLSPARAGSTSMADPPAPGAARGLRVWESEGGHLERAAVRGQRAEAAASGAEILSVGTGDRLPSWLPAGHLVDLADGTAGHVELAGIPVCLARSGGTVHALLDECSHGQVLLSDGDVEGGYVECWLHGSRFDLVTGKPSGPLATAPVPVYPVRINAGFIEVALPAAPAQPPSPTTPSTSVSSRPQCPSTQTTGNRP